MTYQLLFFNRSVTYVKCGNWSVLFNCSFNFLMIVIHVTVVTLIYYKLPNPSSSSPQPRFWWISKFFLSVNTVVITTYLLLFLPQLCANASAVPSTTPLDHSLDGGGKLVRMALLLTNHTVSPFYNYIRVLFSASAFNHCLQNLNVKYSFRPWWSNGIYLSRVINKTCVNVLTWDFLATP